MPFLICFRLIAREMAKMHRTDPEKVAGIKLNTEPCMWWKSKKYLDLSPDSFPEPERNERFVVLSHRHGVLCTTCRLG